MLVDPGDRPGEVGVRPLLVRRGEDGGERLDELGGDAVVEADSPRWRPERVLVGVDAPEPVVLAFGQVAQAHAPVGSAHVHVGVLVVPQVPAEVEQRGRRRDDQVDQAGAGGEALDGLPVAAPRANASVGQAQGGDGAGLGVLGGREPGRLEGVEPARRTGQVPAEAQVVGQIADAVVREAEVPAGPGPGQYGAGGDVVVPAVREGEPEQNPAVVVDECGALAPHVVEPFVDLPVGAEAACRRGRTGQQIVDHPVGCPVRLVPLPGAVLDHHVLRSRSHDQRG